MSLKYKAAKFLAETFVGGALAAAGDKIGEAIGEGVGRRINPKPPEQDDEKPDAKESK